MEAEGVNLVDYAPVSCTIMEARPEYFRGAPEAYAWGWGIDVSAAHAWFGEKNCQSENDFSAWKRKYRRIQAGRCFVVYVRLTDQYASRGLFRDVFLNFYHEWRMGLPSETVYAFRIKITKDETGKNWDYMKLVLPLR